MDKGNLKEESKKETNEENKVGFNEEASNEETKADANEVNSLKSSSKHGIVEYIMVIGFHHHLGGQVLI